MEAKGGLIRLALFCTVLLLLHTREVCCASASQGSDKKVYIVYMGEVSNKAGTGASTNELRPAAHHSMLASVLGSDDAAQKSLIYSYANGFDGFAASLSPADVERVQKLDGVVSVFENKKKRLHTTRSWDFVGLPQTVNRNLNVESDIIIGVLDTGIWPESESFKDTGLSPPPAKWKGTCQSSAQFQCNNKIIGARYYVKSSGDDDGSEPAVKEGAYNERSPRDFEGHGTHTASTAAGNVVKNASLYGLAQGAARGGVPAARIAVYKICWYGFCMDADILKAFDDAISDGVDIISVSFGSDGPSDYFDDPIAIGSFHAMRNGILTTGSAGNSGPLKGSVSNYAPWIFNVAASTIDRRFNSQLVLGNNQTFTGLAVNTFSMDNSSYPFIYGGNAVNSSGGSTYDDASTCLSGSMNRSKMEGKIVLCETLDNDPDKTILGLGGAGVVIIHDDVTDVSNTYLVPATLIQPDDQGDKVFAYVNSTSSPQATILKSTVENISQCPVVASFSSRGPNPVTVGILKPDVTAPGMSILAAWSRATTVTGSPGDTRVVDYNIISGTSMSCPHVTGAAAYVKSYHPLWSPAAIRSALMTTAIPLNRDYAGNEDGELAYGAGQINPRGAINPGLVYDSDVHSYVGFLCSQGYKGTALQLVIGNSSMACPTAPPQGLGAFNYPSIMVATKPSVPISASFLRNVKNVGYKTSKYKAVVKAPPGIDVSVEPNTLSFTREDQVLSFVVNVTGKALPANTTTLISGSLTWTFYKFNVRSPIVIFADPTIVV